MAGPYPQYSDAALSQPNYSESYQSYPYPDEDEPPGQRYQPAAASVYPGMLPPPVPYPARSRWRLVAAILLVIAVVAGATTAIVYAVSAGSGGKLTETSAKTAIQNYLDAMLNGDTEIVTRNTLCGLYDGVKDKRSDQALARLSSETFRKQFSEVDVTSIDKMVFLAPNQARVLFSMQVIPVTRGSQKKEEQAIAELISQDNRVLVCSYVLKSAGQF